MASKEKSDYWIQFWKEHGEMAVDANPQQQVLRTLNKQPIEAKKWSDTLAYIKGNLSLHKKCKVLDLCGGNGLIGSALAEDCQSVVIVDISDDLLKKVPKKPSNITAMQGDMREVDFEPASFDRILCYAALQYLSLPEAARLFEKIHRWLKDDGIFFIGDIPDLDRIWKFFNSLERQANYFNNLKNDKAIVGTWFGREWLTKLAKCTGFQSSETFNQPEDQIYSWFRFDMNCKK